jgi:hypothetical protein
MTTQLERIEYELKLAGYRLEPVKEENWNEDDYVQNIGNCAWEVCKLFCEQGHSGMSAGYTLSIIKTLLDGQTLTPLTDNPYEWTNCSGYCEDETKMYQSKRNFGCFSEDNLKTYYDINAEENKQYELDENGNKTGWACFVGRDKAVKHELKHYEG